MIVSVLPHPGADESANVIVASPQLSVAVAMPVQSGVVQAAGPHSTVAFAGQVITGAIPSLVEIVWLHEAWLPQSSVAVQVRVITVVVHNLVLLNQRT